MRIHFASPPCPMSERIAWSLDDFHPIEYIISEVDPSYSKLSKPEPVYLQYLTLIRAGALLNEAFWYRAMWPCLISEGFQDPVTSYNLRTR